MVGGDFLCDTRECGRSSSTVVGQFYQESEVILLEFKHDAADQAHSDGKSVGHLGDDAMEAGPNDHDSSLDILSQRGRHTMEDIHCHRPTAELLHGNVGFSREADVLQGES